MSLNARNYTQPAIFANSAQTIIPVTPSSGVAYRDPNINPALYDNGQPFDAIADSRLWNQLLYLLSSFAKDSERFGFLRYSPMTDEYVVGSNVTGESGDIYRCIQANGSATDVGPKKPEDESTFWETLASYIARTGGGGGSSNTDGYVSEFKDFMEQTPLPRWRERNGDLITNASQVVPELYNYLQQPENTWKCVTEAGWQALKTQFAEQGKGGAPKFVINTAQNTIRLPDTRGQSGIHTYSGNTTDMFGAKVGESIKAGIPEIKGQIPTANTQWTGSAPSGPFYEISMGNYDGDQTGAYGWTYGFDVSRVTTTQPVNTGRHFVMIGCVYVGAPLA